MTDAEENAERVFDAVKTYVDSRLNASEVEKRAMSDRIAVLERFVVAALEGKVG